MDKMLIEHEENANIIIESNGSANGSAGWSFLKGKSYNFNNNFQQSNEDLKEVDPDSAYIRIGSD